ncbi:SHOCT domain-containing protein [Actinomycetospora sp. TBRC 11914]|uniref:SHOCT domain-containing protein n=1 Tax=Actinomycetospora sp. TBRC 11914 TaxID=2729387 RepID=UPI0020070F55|nr:SHOCT domain-containing protein [Actinomycetospora sp. TBRC 11914]
MTPAIIGVTGLLVWVLLLTAVVALLGWSRSARSPQVRAPDAREVLDQRFARGEIDADEYATRRRVLEDR